MKHFRALIRDTEAVSSVEYSLILAIVGTFLAIFAVHFGGVVSVSVNEASTCIETKGENCT
jgi:Flp pilus assembly pilin Flp